MAPSRSARLARCPPRMRTASCSSAAPSTTTAAPTQGWTQLRMPRVRPRQVEAQVKALGNAVGSACPLPDTFVANPYGERVRRHVLLGGGGLRAPDTCVGWFSTRVCRPTWRRRPVAGRTTCRVGPGGVGVRNPTRASGNPYGKRVDRPGQPTPIGGRPRTAVQDAIAPRVPRTRTGSRQDLCPGRPRTSARSCRTGSAATDVKGRIRRGGASRPCSPLGGGSRVGAPIRGADRCNGRSHAPGKVYPTR